MKTVELFAGIGGFRLAADSRGHQTVWANDIDPKACAVYRARFDGGELRAGDIQALLEEVPAHDLLTAGFPCQPFSSAGKKKGVRDPRGTLFQAIIEVLRRHHPRYFILENVKRLLSMEKGRHFATILNSLSELDYQVEWRLLNSMNLGLPQNRQRVFLLGSQRPRSTRAGRLSSVQLATANDLSGLTDAEWETLWQPDFWLKIEDHGRRFPTWGVTTAGSFVAVDLAGFSERKPPVSLRAVLQEHAPKEFDFTDSTLQWLSANTPVNRFVQGVEILSNQAGGARMGYTIFGINGVAPTLTSTTSRHYERYKIGERYRRLTNVEYARIQGFPDDHCSAVSVYDQYALIGNAVPPPLAGWVMDRMRDEGVSREQASRHFRPRDLFDMVH